MPHLASQLMHVKEEGKGGRSHLYLHHLPHGTPSSLPSLSTPLCLSCISQIPQGLALPSPSSPPPSTPNAGHRRCPPPIPRTSRQVWRGGCRGSRGRPAASPRTR